MILSLLIQKIEEKERHEYVKKIIRSIADNIASDIREKINKSDSVNDLEKSLNIVNSFLNELLCKKELPLYEFMLLEKKKVEGTNIMSFKFSKQNKQQEGKGHNDDDARYLNYTAGQYAYFDIGGVFNDPKGPIRHFTLTSFPTENFIIISTRIRDSPYKKSHCITRGTDYNSQSEGT